MMSEWIFLILALSIAVAGLIGGKRRNRVCIVAVSVSMPLMILAALWYEISIADIATYLCVIACGVMLGLPERGEK